VNIYGKLNKLRQLSDRLASNKFSQADIEYLSDVLDLIVRGMDPNVALNINSDTGVAKSDYLTLLNLQLAFHYITCATDPESYLQETEDKIKDKKIPLKKAVYTAADKFGIDRSRLYRYWYKQEYQHLKTSLLPSKDL
jgi:hypothetical protein